MLSAFAVFAVGFFVRPIGGAVLGSYADRHGRRAGMTLTILLMAGASLAMALIPRGRLEAAVLDLRGEELDLAARQSVPAPESCRSWGGARQLRFGRICLGVLVMLALLVPMAMLWALTVWAVLSLALLITFAGCGKTPFGSITR